MSNPLADCALQTRRVRHFLPGDRQDLHQQAGATRFLPVSMPILLWTQICLRFSSDESDVETGEAFGATPAACRLAQFAD